MNFNRMETTTTGLMIGFACLAIGFGVLMTVDWGSLALLVGGIAAWAIAFGRQSKLAFGRPHKLWLVIAAVAAYFVIGLVIDSLATLSGLHWASNPAVGHLGSLFIILPFMLMGEELLGIGILEGARSKGLSMVASSLLSALIFALMHVPTYWDHSLFSTLLHVFLLQGAARLIFNYVYLKTGRSIWGSWITHVVVDYSALLLATL